MSAAPVHARLRALTCGWLTGATGLFLRGEEGRLRVPVPAFLVEHPEGLVLFDAGLHPDAARDPEARLGPAAGVFEVELGRGEDAAARLAAAGVEPRAVRWLVLSHLHFDHAGGAASFPEARPVVQRREWEAGHRADAVRRNTYLPEDYARLPEPLLVDGEHDLFGDGSVVCVPTFGHTPGHQSLRVRTAGGATVLCADACYLRRTLAERHLPAVVHDEEGMRASLDALAAREAAGERLVFGHDPELWRQVPQAPRAMA
ncbi:MAG: N-acyl homoserine lactonase family protein [Myxococcota bacterium]|nr:N-acyl homoserine lactonase family protein [Myxococcota bacterium]